MEANENSYLYKDDLDTQSTSVVSEEAYQQPIRLLVMIAQYLSMIAELLKSVSIFASRYNIQ